MQIKKNLQLIKNKIAESAKSAGRNPEDIKLLVVTKTHSAEIVDLALQAGAEYIGENKIQESETKLPQLTEEYKEFHFIGHLQSNKIKKLMPLQPSLIHSIDKLSTAKKLNNYLVQSGKTQNILIQVNTSNEESKFGIEPEQLEDFLKEISELKNLQVKGLMTIGLTSTEETEVRKGFQKLKRLFELHQENSYSNIEMKYLSMGMTNDFKIAIEEGANIIRIGSAIFGTRIYT